MLTFNSFRSYSTTLSALVAFLCLLAAFSVSTMGNATPILIVIGLMVVVLTFSAPSVVFNLLILSMLLSPEIGFGAVAENRNVVIRLEDLMLIVFSLAMLARSALTKHRKAPFIKTPINRSILFYILTCIFATIQGILLELVSPAEGFFYVLKYVEYILIFFLVSAHIKSKQQLLQFTKVFVITFFIVNLWAFSQIGDVRRVSAPFEGTEGEPNTLGGYQVLLLSLIIGLMAHQSIPTWSWFLLFSSLLCLVPFAHTLSRASYLAIIPAYLTHVVYTKTRARTFLIMIMIILVALSFFALPDVVKERIKYTFVPQEQQSFKVATILGVKLGPSASARIDSWNRAFQKWREYPLLGKGITGGGFLDSQFVRNFVETGVVGSLAFLILLVSIFRNTYKIYRSSKDKFFRGLALGFLAGHVGMIIHSFTANTFILIRVMEPYWFLAAMVMCIPRLEAVMFASAPDEKKNSDVPATHDKKERKILPRNINILINPDRI